MRQGEKRKGRKLKKIEIQRLVDYGEGVSKDKDRGGINCHQGRGEWPWRFY